MERNGWPERFNLFPRLRKVAEFLGAPVVRESSSSHFKPFYPDFVEDMIMERIVGRDVMVGLIDAPEGLIELEDVHQANLMAWGEISDSLRNPDV